MQKMENPFFRVNLLTRVTSLADFNRSLKHESAHYMRGQLREPENKMDNPFLRKYLFSHCEASENLGGASICPNFTSKVGKREFMQRTLQENVAHEGRDEKQECSDAMPAAGKSTELVKPNEFDSSRKNVLSPRFTSVKMLESPSAACAPSPYRPSLRTEKHLQSLQQIADEGPAEFSVRGLTYQRASVFVRPY